MTPPFGTCAGHACPTCAPSSWSCSTTAPTTSAGSGRRKGISVQGLIEEALAPIEGGAGDRARRRAGPTPASTRSARWRASRVDVADRRLAARARAQRASARRRPRRSSVDDGARRLSRALQRDRARPTSTGSCNAPSCRRSSGGTPGTSSSRSTSTLMQRGVARRSSASTISRRSGAPGSLEPHDRPRRSPRSTWRTAAASSRSSSRSTATVPPPHGAEHGRHAGRDRPRASGRAGDHRPDCSAAPRPLPGRAGPRRARGLFLDEASSY